ncbi:hypothetical protein [Acinetobacter nematophilus]|uniref:Uncharacterized protein n=1 Tax=Acinetobacter nematophilus TaxID=2994642 RepID=A0A9X3DTP1_9GAMM|nr:hypothetical protein [Acinetobacter nematophilus]MCX5468133.1 hypothetical protein [Acinetobacter nematophilus]
MVILPWGDMDVAVGKVQDIPLTHEQKQSAALLEAQGLTSPTKSEASPTQRYLNFQCKVWH